MKKTLKEIYIIVLVSIIILILFSIKFPYYINAPGGITNMSEKVEIDGYDSKGSLNLAYVREYRATIPTLLISLFNKDWKVLKQDTILLDNEDNHTYVFRDKELMDESISNAINVAYKKANKPLKILSTKINIIHILNDSNTDLKVGDEIISINNTKINSKNDITLILNELNEGTKVSIKVRNNDKEYERYAYIREEEDKKILGILVVDINQYKTNPKVNVNIDENESGSSGGLITALSIYNSLVPDDITQGLTIVGTGTIDLDGNIGSIGGVEYKLKSAVKNDTDLFIVPNGENYKEAIKLKKEYNYDIEILGVSTFDEVIKYLEEM